MSDIDQTSDDRITGAAIVDGVLVLRRYDGSRLEVPTGGGSFDPDVGGPAIRLDNLIFGTVAPQDDPSAFYQANLTSVSIVNSDGSLDVQAINEDHGMWEVGPYQVELNGNVFFIESGIYLITYRYTFAADATGSMRWAVLRKNETWAPHNIKDGIPPATIGTTEIHGQVTVVINSGMDQRKGLYDEGYDPIGSNVQFYASHNANDPIVVEAVAYIAKIG